MPTLTPVANGFFQIAKTGATTYTRTAPANPNVKEGTGNNDIVAVMVFDISGLSGTTVTSLKLNTGVNSIVAGTGAADYYIVEGSGTVASSDSDLFANIHEHSPEDRYESAVDTVGAVVISLLGFATSNLQALIDTSQTQWAIGVTFPPESSIGENFTLSAAPTITVTISQAVGRNLFWVGGSAAWDSTAGTKWALTSGGVGGEAIPVIGVDNVRFDSNSGSAATVITVGTGGTVYGCRNLDTTGYLGTFRNTAGSILEIVGNLYIDQTLANFDFDGIVRAYGDVEYNAVAILAAAGQGRLEWWGASGANQYYRNNGQAANTEFNLEGGSTVHLTSNANSANAVKGVHLRRGYLDAAGYDISMGVMSFSGTEVRGLTMGAGRWEGKGGAAIAGWNAGVASAGTNANLTITRGTSTIELTHTGANYSKEFFGGDKTWYDLLFSGTVGAADVDFAVYGDNTFHALSCDAAGTVVIGFNAGSTQTAEDISGLAGSAGDLVTLTGHVGGFLSPGSTWSLAKVGGGTLSIDYVRISDCTPPVGTTVYCGVNSIDGGGNNARVIFAGHGSIEAGGTDAEIPLTLAGTNPIPASVAASNRAVVAIEV